MKLNEEQLKELEILDNQRRCCAFLAGDLSDLSHWLDSGYKDCEGKTVGLDLLYEKIDSLRQETNAILDIINFKRKQYEDIKLKVTKL